MKKSFLLLFVLGQIISCGSDSLENNYSSYDRGTELSEDDLDVSEGYLLKKRSWSKYGETKIQGEVAYEYDEQDRLILETSHYYYENTIPELNITGGVVKYTYEEGVVIATYHSHENELKSTTRYIKEPNNIIRSEMHFPDGTSRLLSIAHLDNSCGRTKYEYFNSKSERTGYAEFEYVDANCSSIVTGYDDDGVLGYTDYYTMDSKNGWHSSIGQHHNYGNITYHNTIVAETKDATGNMDESFSYKSEIIYNSLDYPVSEIQTHYDGRKMAYFYEYY